MPFQKPSTTTRARSSRFRMLISVLGSISEPGGRAEAVMSGRLRLGSRSRLRLAEDGFYPLLVIEVPLHSFADAAFECVSWSPAKFALDFRSVYGVTTIMAGTIFHKSNELAGIATKLRREFIDQIGNQFHDAEVRPLIMAADVVGFCQSTAREDLPKGF